MKFGVNIDHIATLRQARRGVNPDPISAVAVCEKAGADSIVAHLREDRRHIQDADIVRLKKAVTTRFNLEMSMASEIVRVALKIHPDEVTLVPERRQEITTEGGLDVVRYAKRVRTVIRDFSDEGIVVSLFIDPDRRQVEAAFDAGACMIEFHTGRYAVAKTQTAVARELKKLTQMTQYASDLEMTVNAGHGLDYENVKPVAAIKGMTELNIGHSIISRAVFMGLDQAVRKMKNLIGG